MKYSTVTEAQLDILEQGLDLLGHISRDLVPSTLYLYGLVKPDSPIIAAANEAAWEDQYAGEEREENLNIQTIAVSVRLSGDVLRSLLGSGLRAEDEDFEYMLNGELHGSSFTYMSGAKPILTLTQFSKVVLSDDAYWLKDFLQAEGMTQERQHPSGVVRRTEEAVGEHGGAEQTLHQHPHQSSLRAGKRWGDTEIQDLVDRLWGD